MLEQRVDHEWVPAQDRLVQSKFSSRVDLWPFLFHDHVQNREVEIARVLQELNDEVFLVEEDVDVEFLEFHKLENSLDIGVLAGKVQWRREQLDVPLLVLLVLLVVLQLVNAAIHGLDGVLWEEI